MIDWRQQARALVEVEGLTFREVARRLRISRHQAAYWGSPEARDQAKARVKRATTPDLWKRCRVRKQARDEARETGEPLDRVLAKWGVSYVRPDLAANISGRAE